MVGMAAPENMCIAVVTALISSLQAEIGVLRDLTTAILDFGLPVTCHSISTITVRKPVPINTGIAVGISLISSLIAEICGFLFNGRHIGFITSGYV